MGSMDEFFAYLDGPVEREVHPAAIEVEELLKSCVVTKGRSSGPGGQHRNKVSTHVTVEHVPTGISGQAGERRSAEENRKVAVRRLRMALAIGVRVGVPSGDVRSEMWRRRCVKGRIACSVKHWEYPAMVAEGLDVLVACGLDVKKAGVRLECTGSQLVKLIGGEGGGLVYVNGLRVEKGLGPLKG